MLCRPSGWCRCRWDGIEIAPGEIDPSASAKPVTTDIEPGLPANGQVFTTAA
jgi:hypothetical protein